MNGASHEKAIGVYKKKAVRPPHLCVCVHVPNLLSLNDCVWGHFP